jgi:hypothetical protein
MVVSCCGDAGGRLFRVYFERRHACPTHNLRPFGLFKTSVPFFFSIGKILFPCAIRHLGARAGGWAAGGGVFGPCRLHRRQKPCYSSVLSRHTHQGLPGWQRQEKQAVPR